MLVSTKHASRNSGQIVYTILNIFIAIIINVGWIQDFSQEGGTPLRYDFNFLSYLL